MRRHAPLSDYTRAIAFHEKDVGDRDNLLSVLAVNELQMLYLLVKLSGCYTDKDCGGWRPAYLEGAFEKPTMQHIKRVARMFA